MSKFDIFRIEELAVFRKLGEEGEKGNGLLGEGKLPTSAGRYDLP